ncbi:MAG: polyphosphate kinase 1 [Acidimicrobiales bacterium]
MNETEEAIDIAVDGPERFRNRELSWLDFNARVLAQAFDPDLPLLERLKFCAIYSSNLDEFFMVRVAGLRDQVAAGITRTPPDGLTPLQQLDGIRHEVAAQAAELERALLDEVLPALANVGVAVVDWGDLAAGDRVAAAEEFSRHIFPVLTPLAVDPGHPFPYISSLSLNLAVLVSDPSSGKRRFARIKVPPTLSRFIELPSGVRVPIEQVMAAHLDQLFPGMTIVGAWPFRVTRNADLTLDDEEADDLLEAVELELRRRRFGRAIRLEVDQTMPAETLQLLKRELDVDDDMLFRFRGLLDPTGFFEIASLPRADLTIPNFVAATPPALRDLENSSQLFARIREHDVLLHHPYDSFADSVAEFVRQASRDPKVLAIKLTLYRTSGDSPIVKSLIRAAERGKQVAVLVELKARFDEQANIEWARRLEEAGVHVVYGLVGLKIHTKITLVVRSESDGLRRYCHVGTGNYNAKTARIYEDVGLLTADRAVGEDLTQLFNSLTGYGREMSYHRLLVAPTSLRPEIQRLIDAEMAAPTGRGHVVMKMNSLVDAELIDQLYAASQAGVRVDLIIRGICCLRPGVPGLSDNITVRSIVGRYLEHSRIFRFANAADPTEGPIYYFGSADMMPRNLDRRVEAVVRAVGDEVKARLQEIVDVNLADDTNSWCLDPVDGYRRIAGGTVSAHDRLEELAHQRAERKDAEPSEAETPSINLTTPEAR